MSDDVESLELHLNFRSWRVRLDAKSDLDFTDDLVLFKQEVGQPQEIHNRLKGGAAKVELPLSMQQKWWRSIKINCLTSMQQIALR